MCECINRLDTFFNKECKEKNFSGDCIAILLGAGSSKGGVEGCNMLTWSELLQMMQGDSTVIKPSRYLEVAGNIEERLFERGKNFTHNYLNKINLILPEASVDAFVQPNVSERMVRFVEETIRSNIGSISGKVRPGSTLESLIEICQERITNDKRTIVITYNYEDMFEAKLRERLEDRLKPMVRSYHEISELASALVGNSHNGCVDIFYVHGRIPIFDPNNGTKSRSIILSQQSYDRLLRNNLMFGNQIQYIIQAGIPMVAVGFSFDDVNFSRLRTDVLANIEHHPPFYALQYCDFEDCKHCTDEKRLEMEANFKHIKSYRIEALPLRKGNIGKTLKGILSP